MSIFGAGRCGQLNRGDARNPRLATTSRPASRSRKSACAGPRASAHRDLMRRPSAADLAEAAARAAAKVAGGKWGPH
jgi:hypothetical protein